MAASGSSASITASMAETFDTKKHVSFLLRCLRMLPAAYTSADDQRMTLGYFALAGLSLLGSTHRIPADEAQELIDWVYEQQAPEGGFRGSPSTPFARSPSSTAGTANVAMTYAALLVLAMLRDDFSRLKRPELLRYIGALQHAKSGGFAAELPPHETKLSEVETDPRFTYCAVAVCSMLGDFTHIDTHRARRFLEGCQRYDGGFGASATQEAHAGMTYCCVAALHLLAQAPQDARAWPRSEEAVAWLAHRQVSPSQPGAVVAADARPDLEPAAEEEEEEEELTGGFQGRPSKLPPDVCYSFWNGAALALLSAHELVDARADAGYVLRAQSRVGGIAKVPGDHPDLLHTYLGLASLSLHQASPDQGEPYEGERLELGLAPLDAAYNCTLEVKRWIASHLSQ